MESEISNRCLKMWSTAGMFFRSKKYVKRYYVKLGYFGTLGKKYISRWKAIVYKIFTDIVVYKEGIE